MGLGAWGLIPGALREASGTAEEAWVCLADTYASELLSREDAFAAAVLDAGISRFAAAAAAGALVAFAAHVVRVWPFTADDSFITFRYSQNLVHGHANLFSCEHVSESLNCWLMIGTIVDV